jgi:hypothetical protein
VVSGTVTRTVSTRRAVLFATGTATQTWATGRAVHTWATGEATQTWATGRAENG